jgi:predicted dehydrogenase
VGAPVGLGIVGLGPVASRVVESHLEDRRCRVVAVCDPLQERAERLAGTWDVPRRYTRLEDLLQDDAVEAVELLTPTHLHHPHVLAALGTGRHVSCQPPLTTTFALAEELGRAAEQAGRILRLSDPCRHHPTLVRAREIVASGAIGEPVRLRIRTVVGQPVPDARDGPEPDGYLWRLDERVPGGHAFDAMTTRFALAEWLAGTPVTTVRCMMRREDSFYEPFVAVLEYGDRRLLGVVDSQYAPEMPVPGGHQGADDLVEVQGTAGLVVVTGLGAGVLGSPALIVRERDGGLTEEAGATLDEGFRQAARNFVDALTEGHEPVTSPLEAARAVQVCLAAYRSAVVGRVVDVGSIEGAVVAPGWPS